MMDPCAQLKGLRVLFLAMLALSLAARGEEAAGPSFLPPIDGWMYSHTGAPANWFGRLYLGKPLREPINVVILDAASNSASEASARLFLACRKAGFPSRIGHSGGYRAILSGAAIQQWSPDGKPAFSDAPFERANDHGRIFGPIPWRSRFVFVAAFSRETLDLLPEIRHKYVSFNQARNSFAANLERTGTYQHIGWIRLENLPAADASFSVGDHDGRAIVLATTLKAGTLYGRILAPYVPAKTGLVSP